MAELIDFYGKECISCQEMMPLIEKLEKELKVKVKKVEVWHDSEGAKLFQELDAGKCGSVPFFINTKTGKFVCGKASYAKLKAVAQGK